jgi:hypothetical protein
MDSFSKKNPSLVDIVEDWWDEDMPFHTKDNRLYLTQYFKPPYQILTSMICRLYGEEVSTHFKLEWTLIAHIVAEI